MGDGAELIWQLQAGRPDLLPARDNEQPPVPPMFMGLASFQSDWWTLAWLQAMDPEGHPEEPPCPHCHYFGSEHHPACGVTERRARAWYARRGLTEPVPGTPEPLVRAALEVRHG